MKQIFTTILIFGGLTSHSQSISNVTSLQQGNSVVITYDLNGSTSSVYFVKLYYSTDDGQNFSNELTQVSGDVKGGVKSGIGKKIIWAADKEVNYLNSSVVFKVEAEVRKSLPKPVTFENNTVEITKATRNGDEVTIEFLFTQNTQQEVQDFNMKKTSEITGMDGKQYKATSGKLGSEIMGDSYTKDVKCIRGVPVKGQLTFQTEGNDQVIQAFKLDFFYTSIVVRNIPVQ